MFPLGLWLAVEPAADPSPYIDPAATVIAVVVGGAITTIAQFVLDRQRRAADRKAQRAQWDREAEQRREQWDREDDLRRELREHDGARLREAERREDILHRREHMIAIYIKAFDQITKFDNAKTFAEMGKHNSDLKKLSMGALDVLADVVRELEKLEPEVAAFAPEDTGAAFNDMYGDMLNVNGLYLGAPPEVLGDDDPLGHYSGSRARFRRLARRDMGHHDADPLADVRKMVESLPPYERPWPRNDNPPQ